MVFGVDIIGRFDAAGDSDCDVNGGGHISGTGVDVGGFIIVSEE